MKVYLNGEWIDESRAAIPVQDRGFLLGDGIFETIAVTQGRPELLERHLDRFYGSADALKIYAPLGRGGFREAIGELLKLNGIEEGRLRITMTRGIPDDQGIVGLGEFEDRWRPTLLIAAKPMKIDRDFSAPPIPRVLKTSPRRLPSDSVTQAYKSTSYLEKLHARDAARAAGAWDALLLNTRGQIMECGVANIFWWKDGALHTPAIYAGALPGVVRGAFLKAARGEGLMVREGLYRLSDLDNAEFVFATNSILGVAPIAQIDHRCFDVDHAVRHKLGGLFLRTIDPQPEFKEPKAEDWR